MIETRAMVLETRAMAQEARRTADFAWELVVMTRNQIQETALVEKAVQQNDPNS